MVSYFKNFLTRLAITWRKDCHTKNENNGMEILKFVWKLKNNIFQQHHPLNSILVEGEIITPHCTFPLIFQDDFVGVKKL